MVKKRERAHFLGNRLKVSLLKNSDPLKCFNWASTFRNSPMNIIHKNLPVLLQNWPPSRAVQHHLNCYDPIAYKKNSLPLINWYQNKCIIIIFVIIINYYYWSHFRRVRKHHHSISFLPSLSHLLHSAMNIYLSISLSNFIPLKEQKTKNLWTFQTISSPHLLSSTTRPHFKTKRHFF